MMHRRGESGNMIDGNGGNRDSCPVCTARQIVPFLSVAAHSLVRCLGCGVVFLNPLPTEDVSHAFTAEHYNPERVTRQFLGREAEKREEFGRRLSWIDAFGPPTREILDVGCGPGFFLDEARKRGWDACGSEISPASVAHARTHLGLQVSDTPIQHMPFPEATFGAITFWDSLEHFRDPLGVLRAVERMLVPGGVLAVVTPNVSSLIARLCGPNWGWLKPPDHLFLFDPGSLAKILALAGFQLLEMTSKGGDATHLYQVIVRLGAPLGIPASFFMHPVLRRPSHFSCQVIHAAAAPARYLLGRALMGPLIYAVARRTT
ncbi:MAG: class I SAM-dependent methyltransferase [Acidobacteria bacterium]|nr:class I SAM-dependent methyltransferase [Acidobacteriota bacterium]